MSRIFNTNYNHKTLDIALLILRVGVSALMLTHGYPKIINLFSGNEINFADPFGFGMTATLAMAVFAEFFCSILLLFGLATRVAVIPLIATMFVALLTAHAGQPIAKKELVLLYLLIYVVIFLTGAGAFSMDKIFNGKAARSRRGY